MKIIGYPSSIEDSKYPRNYLTFNLCFICIPNMRTVQYEPLVKKLAKYLINLELECNFLYNESTKSRLPSIMKEIMDQINFNRACVIPVSKFLVEIISNLANIIIFVF